MVNHRTLNRRLNALRRRFPAGASLTLDFCALGAGAVGTPGWRISVRLPAEWDEALAARVRDAHLASPFIVRDEWVRWPTGLSLGAAPTIRRALRDAARQADRMLALLACPTCGRIAVEPPAPAA